MLSIILCMLCGIVAGFFLRRWRFAWLDGAIIVIIWLLLFELGIEVGGNRQVLGALPKLGLSALEIAVVAMLGSCLAAMGLARWVKLDRRHVASGALEERATEDASADAMRDAASSNASADAMRDAASSNASADAIQRAASGAATRKKPSAAAKKEHPLKGSLIILAFFVAGCLLGYFWQLEDTTLLKDVGFYTLAVLIVMVGLSIGHNREVLNSLKSQDRRLLLLPLFTILGTLAAVALLGLVMPFSLTETLALGSGQAYYSLSSIMITQSKGIELGTVALLANIIRELLTLLSAPLLVIVFGRLAPISAGGATTADTTLPIIRQVCGSDLAILSVYHGFVVDFSVPFMVTLFCSL